MNPQTAYIRIVDSKAGVAEVIRCRQLVKSYRCGNVLAIDQADFELHSCE